MSINSWLSSGIEKTKNLSKEILKAFHSNNRFDRDDKKSLVEYSISGLEIHMLRIL